MSEAFQGFDARLKRISQNREKVSQGYVGQVGKDGLIVFRPSRRSRGFPIRGLAILLVGVFCFKGLILAHLGDQVYEARVSQLASGSVVEQAGAYAMKADPISMMIAQKVRPLIK